MSRGLISVTIFIVSIILKHMEKVKFTTGEMPKKIKENKAKFIANLQLILASLPQTKMRNFTSISQGPYSQKV